MSIQWKTGRENNLPDAVNQKMVDTWREQSRVLENHAEFKDWVYFIEWPDFMKSSEEGGSVSPVKLTESQRRPLLRDTQHPVKVDMPTVWARREHLFDIIKFLKDPEGFSYTVLSDLTAADYLNSPDPDDLEKNRGRRFQMIYTFRSLKYRGQLIRVVLPVGEDEKAPSLTEFWVGADWPEREVFDLMGIEFEGHPDLRRILMPEKYRGHPLRKDFPIQGIGEDYLIEDLLEEHLIDD